MCDSVVIFSTGAQILAEVERPTEPACHFYSRIDKPINHATRAFRNKYNDKCKHIFQNKNEKKNWEEATANVALKFCVLF